MRLGLFIDHGKIMFIIQIQEVFASASNNKLISEIIKQARLIPIINLSHRNKSLSSSKSPRRPVLFCFNHNKKMHSLGQQVQVTIKPSSARKPSYQGIKPPKWLSFYNPTVDVNHFDYHFVSNPKKSHHQKVTLKSQSNPRKTVMYFDIEDAGLYHSSTYKREDNSGLKDFSYLDFVQKPQEIILNKEQAIRDSQWAQKYYPKAFYELLTDQLHNRNVLGWLKSWDWIVFHREAPTLIPLHKFQNQTNNRPQFTQEYNHNRLLLLSGPPGCGKTTLARVVAKHCGYDVMEINASDDRSSKALIEKIEALGKNNSVMNGKPIMIIIDQVDGALEQDGNGIKEVLNFIQSGGKSTAQKPHHKEAQKPKPSDLPKTQPIHTEKHTLIPRPIIFICNDPFIKALKQLRSKAIVVYFKPIESEKIVKRLKEITDQEKVYIENEVLVKIAEITGCDIRGSLSILEYICRSKKQNNTNPKELINKLRLSFAKDSNTSTIEFCSSLMNQNQRSSLKKTVNLKQFSYQVSKLDNKSLVMQTFFQNFVHYKGFFNRKTKECVKLYDELKWADITTTQSFKYNNETDSFLMMLYLYYKMNIVNEEYRKIEFPTGFFDRLNRSKQNREIVDKLVSKWPAFLKSTISIGSVIKEYLYVLYYTVQTSSQKDADILECVSKMITYGIELASRNAPFLFKPEFDSLLIFGQRKLQILYSNVSRTFIEESYEYAKLKSHLLEDLSLTDLNKNTEELMSQLNIKNKRRKRGPQSASNCIKYKFIEGSGTQITYDLKFSFFFQ